MSDFTHLHVHSHYSLLDGLGKITPLLTHAKELGMTSLALTDHGSMYGIIEFIKAAKEVGIKPIIGVEAYLAPQGHQQKRGKIDSAPRHLTLLAQNMQGYKNLIKLVTHANLSGYYYKPRIDYELLATHSEGLIVLSGCLNGDIAKAIEEKRADDARRLIEWHITTFGHDRFFLEVQHHPSLAQQTKLNEALFSFSQEYKVGLVATADTHYIHSEDAEAQDVLVCVQTGKTVQDKDRLCMLGEDYSLKSQEELKETWKAHPEAILNTQRIAEMCQVDIEFGTNRLPHYPLPAGVTTDEALRTLCTQGIMQRYAQSPPEQLETRLEYELDVIKKTGFASYFLIVADFVNEAKRRGILVGPGRGSAAGSLVSYLTNITNLDPLHYNLLFERFLNPERVSMPDIDLDFADDRRDEVIAYVREKYGRQHVAQIITFGTMAARAAVRDAGRASGFPYSFCDTIAKAIPPMMSFAEALKESAELREMYTNDPQAKRLIDTARKLEGVCRHASTHAAGVVITEEPLTEHVPLQLSTTGSDEVHVVTQYAMGAVEALGLLKMDFLGLKNLTIIKNTLERIEQRHALKIDIDSLPLDDAKTYQLLQTGKSTGVFQLESAGMKRYLKELKPTEFEDIISIGALYRPGPMDSIPDFIAAKHGRKKITYLHPILQPILEKTYGVIVTQDQVLEIAREFAGFTYAEADILRKAVGKKIRALLIEQRTKFISSAVKNKQVDKKTAEKVWDFIEPFARYGFNRAHAACYAMIAYQTAYLKANFPAEFMAALLTSDEGNIDRAAIEVAEALSMKLEILPPDINESGPHFTVVKNTEGRDAIRFGLSGIKNVGHTIVTAIIEAREKNKKFIDITDFFTRLPSADMNRKSLESLVRAGAFDSVSERGQVLGNLEKLLLFNRTLHRQHDSGQQGLFGAAAAIEPPRLRLEAVPAATRDERLRWEKELLGMYVSEHPLQELQEALQDIVVPIGELQETRPQTTIRLAGVVNRITKIITKSQKPMLFVQLEDMTGKVEALVFPNLLSGSQEQWVDGAALLLEGKLSDKDGEVKMLTDKVWPLNKTTLASLQLNHSSRSTRRNSAPPRTLIVQLPPHFSRESLEALKTELHRFHAAEGVPVELHIPHQGGMSRVHTAYRLPATEEVSNAMRKLVGARAVRYQ